MMGLASRFTANEFTLVQDSMHKPQISLLVPLFQQSKFVEASLQSILSQREIPCEIIISDDNSCDDTFEIALRQVIQYFKSGRQCHRILLRRGNIRLRRDHIHLLAAKASVDIVAQFHGDDLFDEYRAVALHSSINSVCGSFVASTHIAIDSNGVSVQSADAEWKGLRPLSIDEVARPPMWPDWVIGSSQCWNKSHLSKFESLCMEKNPYAHDRIIPFRASLLCGAFTLASPLYRKRMHSGMWGFADCPMDPIQQSFRMCLINFSALSAMIDDLNAARTLGICEMPGFFKIQDVLLSELVTVAYTMRCNFGHLASRGFENSWFSH